MPSQSTPATVLISGDMEGCATLVHWDEVRPSDELQYERACRIYSEELDAAARGALAGGAQRVIINDAHSAMRNVRPELVDSQALLISGRYKPLYMLQGLASDSVGAAFFIGYHGVIGDAEAVMGHTYSPRVIFACRLNGQTVGELTINAALAGAYGVPVTLVSGDATTLAEARHNLPWATCVETKRSVSYYAAECRSPAQVREEIYLSAVAAVRASGGQPLRLATPIVLEIDTMKTSHADAVCWLPSFRRIGPRTIAFEAPDMPAAYRALMAVIYLGSVANQ